MSKYTIEVDEISFRVYINFDKCDVDHVYDEARAAGIQTIVPSLLCDTNKSIKRNVPLDVIQHTPISNTIDMCLELLRMGKIRVELRGNKYYEITNDELKSIGVEATNTYGLMMGGCFLICKCDYVVFSEELVHKTVSIVNEVFKQYCKFYKK